MNKLNLAQIERLAFLAEECGELIQAVGKVLRFGYESQNPTVSCGDNNREGLVREMGDVLAAINLLIDMRDVDGCLIDNATMAKMKTCKKWLHYQGWLNG